MLPLEGAWCPKLGSDHLNDVDSITEPEKRSILDRSQRNRFECGAAVTVPALLPQNRLSVRVRQNTARRRVEQEHLCHESGSVSKERLESYMNLMQALDCYGMSIASSVVSEYETH